MSLSTTFISQSSSCFVHSFVHSTTTAPLLFLSLLFPFRCQKIMHQPPELPDCVYPTQPIYIYPKSPTPKHFLYLSNLDDQKFLRFSIKYLYLYKKGVCLETLKSSLSRTLVDYYPLAGRLRVSREGGQKLEVDCNGEGAIFAEAFMDFTAEEFLQISTRPNRSWRKLLYRVEGQSFLSIPPLVVQVGFFNISYFFECFSYIGFCRSV